jgi:hypothetical protein
MDELELSKYMNWMEGEYGPQWKEVLKDQLRTNQLGDNVSDNLGSVPNYSFAEKTLPSDMGLLNSREEINQVLGSKLVDNPEYPHIKPGLSPTQMMSEDGVPRGPQLLSEAPFNRTRSFHINGSPSNQLDQWGQTSDPYVFHTQDPLKDYISENFPDTSLGLPSASASAIPAASSSLALETGPSGYASLTASGAESALPYAAEGTSEALAADTATSGSSAWGGPATFAGNMALNMIPTRDKDKVDTPLGDQGSKSGILKGTGKGALTAATISGGNPYATAAGAVLGAYGGSQGYFDSTSAPQVQIGRIKRGRGMPQGLLGGGSMYG